MTHRTLSLRSSPPDFWITVVILLFAAFVRVSAVDYALPYLANPDESNVYRLAQGQRGVLDAGWRAEWLAGYPPGYTAFYRVVVDGMNSLHLFDIHQDMAKVVGMMRIVNALIDMLTIVLVIHLARQLAGWRSALLTAGVYAVSTPFAQNASIALQDPLFTMTVMACVVCGLHAWRHDSVWWALLSTVAGLVAVAVKYPAAPALILPALFFLRYLFRKRLAALPGAALALGMVLATAYGLWFAYGGGSMNNFEGNQARNFFVQNILSPTRWSNVIKAIVGTLGIGLSIGALIALVRRKLSQQILLIGITGLVVLALVPAYLANISSALYPVRYTLPAAAILLSVAASLVARLMRDWSKPTQIIIGLLCVAVLVPELVSYVMPLRLTNPYTAAQKWFEANVPDNSVIWMETIDPFTSLSRYDKGYRGVKNFVGVFGQDNPVTTPEMRASVQYLYLAEQDEKLWPQSEGWESLDHFTKIKTFGGTDYRPPSVSIYLPYTLPNPQETRFTFGDVQLVLHGLSIDTESQIFVESYWQAAAVKPEHDYSYSLYLTPADEPSNSIAQHDGGLGQRPTSTWDDPTEIVPATIGTLDYPSLVQGTFSLWLVIYDSQTGERFALADGTTSLLLQTWTIER